MVCVSFYVICIVELLVSSVICRFSGLVLFTWVFFILFIHHNIHIYFELCTYCKIWDIYLLQNMNSVKYLLFYMELFCDMFGSVLGCYELTHISRSCWSAESCKSEHAVLPHWLCNQKHPSGIWSCSPIVNFLKFTFYHGMVISVIFLIKR